MPGRLSGTFALGCLPDMNETSKDQPSPDDTSLVVRSDWSVGPRTAAWDRLWRGILGGLGSVPMTDAREQLESEVGDA